MTLVLIGRHQTSPLLNFRIMRIGRSKSSFFPSSSSQTLTPSEHHQISRSCTRNLGTCTVASIFCFSMFHESCFFIQKSTQNKISCASVLFEEKGATEARTWIVLYDGSSRGGLISLRCSAPSIAGVGRSIAVV